MMATPQELESAFWHALRSDRTVMLGLDGVEDGHARPMTAQFDGEHGPIWFFGGRDQVLFQNIGSGRRAIASFTAKDHDLFASVQGTLSVDDDFATLERLWSPHLAAWYRGGKNDPNLVLFRLDTENAEIWESGNTLIAGIKMFFGMDPRTDDAGKTAEVSFD